MESVPSRKQKHGAWSFQRNHVQDGTSDVIWRGLWCYITPEVMWSNHPWPYKKQHACLHFNNILVTVLGLL